MATAATIDGERNDPLGAGAILSQSFSMLLNRPGLFATLSLAWWASGILEGWLQNLPVQKTGLWTAAFLVDVLILNPLVYAALIYAASRCYAGRRVSARDAYGRAIRMFPLVAWTYFLLCLIVCAGLCLLIVPAFVFTLWFCVVVPVVVLEGLGGRRALERSRQLTKGRLGTAAVYFGLLVAFALAVGVEVAIVPPGWLRIVLAAALEVFGSTLGTVFVTIFYLSCRAKSARLNTPAPIDTTSGAVAAG